MIKTRNLFTRVVYKAYENFLLNWPTLAIVGIFVIVNFSQFDDPYVIDEAVFPYVAQGILNTGTPVFYNGEYRPFDVGLWHPPLYSYILAAHMLLLGDSVFSVRLFGTICIVASLFFLRLAIRNVAPNLDRYGLAILAAIFVFNPLVISGALIPDIDGTIGMTVVSLGIWVSTQLVNQPTSSATFFWVFSLAVISGSTKFTIAALLGALVIGSAFLAKQNPVKKTAFAFVSYFSGIAVALGLLFGAGKILGFDALGPFNYLFSSIEQRGPSSSGLSSAMRNLLEGTGSNLVWIGPAIIASSLMSIFWLIKARPQNINLRTPIVIFLFSILVIIVYSYITGSPFGFPKYTTIAIPGLAFVIALLREPIKISLEKLTLRNKLTAQIRNASLFLVSSFSLYIVFVTDSRTPIRSLDELYTLSVVVFFSIVVIVFVIVFASSVNGSRMSSEIDKNDMKNRLKAAIGFSLAFSLIQTPIAIQLATSTLNATSDFSTRYYYGEKGMKEFLSVVDKLLAPDSSLIAPKDIGLQLNRVFYEDSFLLTSNSENMSKELLRINVDYLVTRKIGDYSESVYPEGFAEFRKLYKEINLGIVSDFQLWELRSKN